MIAPLLLVLGLLLSGYGLLRIWRAGQMRLARDKGTRLRIDVPPQGSHPVLTLQHKDEVLFGPVQARWSAAPAAAMACGNAERDPALPGGDVPSGRYRVLDAADISGAAEPIRRAFGAVALILRPEDGGRDILLHGVRRHGPGSGGIAVLNRTLDALIQQLGDPRGLQVEIERRSIRREGWGGTGRALSRPPPGGGIKVST
jgi:hypothetical protein